jgi:hypothetical protein
VGVIENHSGGGFLSLSGGEEKHMNMDLGDDFCWRCRT